MSKKLEDRTTAPWLGYAFPAFSSAYILDESRYESQTTKSPELIFRALLDDHGAREVRFERTPRT